MVETTDETVGQASARPGAGRVKERFLGVDVARGIALFSMLAANTFTALGDDGGPTLAGMTVIGRSATLFVMVAGISLAFISGGRHPARGTALRAARASIAVRALLIGGVIGLALGYVAPDDLGVILPYYGLYFLLAIPLLGLRPRTLVLVAGGLTVVGPLVLLASAYLGLESGVEADPTFGTPFTNPVGYLVDILITGGYPAVVYLAYICAGLAIGRLDLSSTKVASRLLGGGLALAVTAWFTSSVLLFRLGGLQQLLTATADPSEPVTRNELIWESDKVASWWWLALRYHHSGTPLDMLHTLGSAMAILGGVLLLTKLPAARRLLRPVGVAGAMTLTIYSAHVPFLALELWSPLVEYLVLVAAALAFAVVWHRWRGQGPLERLVGKAADRARLRVAARHRATARHKEERPAGLVQERPNEI